MFYWSDCAFTIIFTAEAIFKMVAHGLLFPQRAYFKDVWNVMDFVVLALTNIAFVSASVSSSPTVAGLATGRVLRVFRVLRPLRFISHNEGACSAWVDGGLGRLGVWAFVFRCVASVVLVGV